MKNSKVVRGAIGNLESRKIQLCSRGTIYNKMLTEGLEAIVGK
jgi:hypothetical protein